MPDDPAAHLAQQDVIYVGGGNTANMLAIWRVHGIDRALREAWESRRRPRRRERRRQLLVRGLRHRLVRPELRELGDGLGSSAGSFCPHYDGEPERRPTYTRLVSAGVLAAGIRRGRRRGVPLPGEELLEVVSQRDGARGYRVTAEGEEPIEPRLL